jgi:hypothetical protein
MELYPQRSADREQAILRELQSLQQALNHLIAVEQRLQGEQTAITLQINQASFRAYQAQQANLSDQHQNAMDQRSAALATAATLQEQLGRIADRKAEIARAQQSLQVELGTMQAAQRQEDLRLQAVLAQAPELPTPASQQRPRNARRGRGRLLWLAGVMAVVLVLASLGIARQLIRGRPASPPLQRLALSTDNTPFYHSHGNLPTAQSCVAHLQIPCLSPEAIQQAFRLNPLYRSGYDGRGQTIVVVGAGHTATLKADLHHFDQTWGLPDPDLQILQPHGPPAPYTCPGGIDLLEGESTLDVEWAHAIAPGARIVLVIGDNHAGARPEENCIIDLSLLEDVDNAITNHLGQVISMSLGIGELGQVSATPSEQEALGQYFAQGDAIFQRAAAQHITVIAAAGDDGATNPNDASHPASYWKQPNVSWPASDPYVLAVGGTMLSLDAANDYQQEIVWNDPRVGATGGGQSAVYPEPEYQKQVPSQTLFHGHRGVPDVSFPAEGFLLYNTGIASSGLGQANPQWDHWQLVGGTSASAPCWAGLMALANQARGQALGFIQPLLYALQGQGMHDVTQGTNSFHGVTGTGAERGFDLVSGWGTPIADQFIPDLVLAAKQQE